uniref:uncharacterized protein LOC105351310 n=1 Tax=Fragaria vesca subsp. vesca TaxID=101020 RepID=UPI0005CB3726|nr:PREDICTED: uncharacterized protein LOC105351310 [Fragaria vesca subsp. vesca]
MDRMLDGETRIQAEIQLDKYERKLGKFGSAMAESTRKIRSPGYVLWEKYGTQTLELMNFATRIMSLTCSALGYERNWSTFEMIHTKKRNRLEHKRLHALFYVKYNIVLRDRTLKRNAIMTDLIVMEEIESDDEWITEIEDSVLPTNPHWIEDNVEELTLDDGAIRNVSSGKRKTPRKSMFLDDIVDDDSRSNRYDDTNPLFQHGDDIYEGGDDDDGDGGDSDGDDSLDEDILIDDDDFEA